MKSKKTKKIIRIFLWLSAIFVIIFLVAFIIIRIKFPPDKIKNIIASQLSQAVNYLLFDIGKNIMKKLKVFVFDKIIIYEHPSQDSTVRDSAKFVSIDKAYLKYKLSSLLKRTLKIREIVIDHPQIHVSYTDQQQTNFEDLITPSPTAEKDSLKTPADTSAAVISLPIAFELDRFDFKNFNAFVSSESESTMIKAHIGDISLFMKDLSIPHGSWDEIKDKFKAKLKIVSPKSPWNFYVEYIDLKNPYELKTQFDLNIDFTIHGIADLWLKGEAGFGEMYLKEFDENVKINKVPVTKFINLVFNIQINGEKGKINIERLLAQIADEDALSIRGSISDMNTNPFFALSVDNSKIRLSKLVNALKALTLSDYRKQLEGLKVDGTLSFNDTEIHGNPISDKIDEGLVFNTFVKLEDFNASYPLPGINIEELSANLTMNGLYNSKGLNNCKLEARIELLALNSKMNDTTNINIEDFTIDLLTNISNDLFLSTFDLKTRIGNAFGALINFDLSFNSMEKWQNFLANAYLEVKNLDIAKVPLSPGKGLINSNLSLNSSSLDQIVFNLDILTDSLYLYQKTDQLVVSPINITGVVDIATNTNFQDINIKQINLNANNFLSVKGTSEIQEFGQKGFRVCIDSILLNHKEIFDFLPKSFKEGLENLTIEGATLLTAEIDGKIPQMGEPEVSIKSTAHINSNLEYPDVPVTIGALLGNIMLTSDGKSADITAKLNIDSLILDGLRDQPLNNISSNLHFHVPHFDQAKLDTGLLEIPDLKSKFTIFGKVDSLTTDPEINFDLLYTFSAKDSVLLMNDLYLIGNLDAKGNIQLRQPILSINGEISSNKLSAFFTDQFVIQEISGEFPFTQKIDIDNISLINDDYIKPLLADVGSINYNLFRPYYLNKSNKVPYLEMKNIKIADYEISNFVMDINLGNGRIDIPYFALNLYDGNMIGNIAADFDNGELDQAKYYLKANISRLNSAKLSSIGAGSTEESELNMNMEFEGTGLDPTKNIDFDGYFYITKIGSKFADNVLNSLDPKSIDKSIQDTKRLLKWGYKPKLISFEIKHGYLYPTIHLVKGNFFTKLIPLNLSGGKIELARMPIKFFLETQLSQGK